MPYEVGYRRPPAAGQFKKGSSGNPKGRPKGSSNFMTVLVQEMDQKIVVTENGKKKSMTRLKAVVKRIVAGALQGDPKTLLTLVEILRRSAQLQPAEPDSLVPQNYQSILDAYVESQRKAPTKTASTKGGNVK